MDFTNKTVLVTGSSRGIGKAIAVAFGRAGARVVLNASRSKDQLEETKKEMEEMGVSCMAVLADVSDYNACKDMFLQIQDAFGPVDILVNNAGISHIGLFTDMTPEQWQHVLNVNLGSVLNCTHLAVPAMVHNKTGVILNISSMWGGKRTWPFRHSGQHHCLRCHRHRNECLLFRRRTGRTGR